MVREYYLYNIIDGRIISIIDVRGDKYSLVLLKGRYSDQYAQAKFKIVGKKML